MFVFTSPSPPRDKFCMSPWPQHVMCFFFLHITKFNFSSTLFWTLTIQCSVSCTYITHAISFFFLLCACDQGMPFGSLARRFGFSPRTLRSACRSQSTTARRVRVLCCMIIVSFFFCCTVSFEDVLHCTVPFKDVHYCAVPFEDFLVGVQNCLLRNSHCTMTLGAFVFLFFVLTHTHTHTHTHTYTPLSGIFSGALLGVRGSGSLNFYDWETTCVATTIICVFSPLLETLYYFDIKVIV